MNYQVTEVERLKDLPPKGERPLLAVYKLTLSMGGSTFPGVEALQKPETPAPKEGDTLEGQITQSDFGPRFKKEQKFGGNKGGGGSKYEADPKKLREESRRSALFAAIKAAPEGTASADIIKVAEVFHRYIEQDA